MILTQLFLYFTINKFCICACVPVDPTRLRSTTAHSRYPYTNRDDYYYLHSDRLFGGNYVISPIVRDGDGIIMHDCVWRTFEMKWMLSPPPTTTTWDAARKMVNRIQESPFTHLRMRWWWTTMAHQHPAAVATIKLAANGRIDAYSYMESYAQRMTHNTLHVEHISFWFSGTKHLFNNNIVWIWLAGCLCGGGGGVRAWINR